MEKKKNQNILSKTPVLALGALICCALWGGAFPAIKIGYALYNIPSEDTFGQIIFAGCRFFIAGIIALILGSVIYKKLLIPKKGMGFKIVKLSLLQTVGQYFFFYVGLAHTTGVRASIIEALNVFAALLVASLIFRQEKLSSRKIFGSMLGFAGVIWVNAAGVSSGATLSLAGEGAIFLSTIMYAFSSVLIKEYSKEELPFTMSAYQFMAGGLILTGIGLVGKFAANGTGMIAGIGDVLGNITLPQIGILLLLAGISGVAYSLWGQLLKYNPVSKVAVFGFMTPVFGVIFSSIFLSENSSNSLISIVIALVLVSIGTVIAQSE